jgi:hypothetical protein
MFTARIFYTAICLILLIATEGTANAEGLPQGCFSGTASDGNMVKLTITKVSRSKYRIVELSDLNFHGPVYSSNPSDYIIAYNANYSNAHGWYVGKQPRASVSFSVDAIPRVVITRLSKRSIRYHRVLKQLGASNDEPYEVLKSKGTLVLDPSANKCVDLIE